MARVEVDFSGTTVFVAGGTSGINLGIAEGFAAAGARVAVMSRSKDKVDAAVTRLQALTGVTVKCSSSSIGSRFQASVIQMGDQAVHHVLRTRDNESRRERAADVWHVRG